jgi:N-acetylmuramoyl-L-alanine amidase
MATDHTVKQGEHLSQIAEKYGFGDHRLIWNDPANASLRAQRGNPFVLNPGDKVHIPDKQIKEVSAATALRHRFRLSIEKLKLKIAVKDNADKPLANTPLKLNVEGSVKSLTTDGDGKAEREILRTAVSGMITVGEFEVPIKIGHLDPVDQLSGQKARLNNLGYDAGDPAGTEDLQFRSAVEEFQCDRSLKPSGVCDDATQAELKTAHGV